MNGWIIRADIARSYVRTVGIGGFARSLAAKVKGRQDYVDLQRRDCRWPIRLRLPSSDPMVYEQVFLRHEYGFRVGSAPGVIVDAGANIGLASVYFANRFPDAKIVAIEPELSNFDLLQRNVARYPNIFPVHAALWDSNGEIDLIDPGYGTWGFMTGVAGGAAPRHRVRAVTLGTLMSEMSLDVIDILKVDIEGAEKEVFADPSAWIDRVDAIIIELHDRMKAGCSETVLRTTGGFGQRWTMGENHYLVRQPVAGRPHAGMHAH